MEPSSRRVNFRTLTGSSLAHHVALPDHGVGLDGQSSSCLIVGWPVGLSSQTLGVGHPSVMFLFDCWPVGRPMPRTVRGCYRGGTTGETPSYDPAEDHGPSPPTPEVGMPSGSPPLEAFELPISPMSPGLPDPTYIPMTDEQYELETGWLTLFYQPMESIGDNQRAFQLSTCGGSYDDIGEPSSFPYMEKATTELPLPLNTYETGGPSSFPAYAPGGSTYFGDPYATKSFYYGQGSEMFTVAEDGYVDPHGYPYHTTTYLGGSDLYPRCFVCGTMGHLTAVCPRYVELLEIPYLPCARPAGGLTERGRCPNCAMLLYIWRP
ncbi:hypothetical protein F2Q69_00029944 [Brassica cretica]|uniref:CCHC-type domain-containing protein n=1 Tax=Brassica cretica TaxID=69181 RepID=A0A8S9RRL9_BRACR|nr:hypothetical protein F2Q69_00029944 [Brassica cretica]